MSRDVMRVSARSNPGKVAGAIAGMVREGKDVSVQTIGFAAMVRAVCGIALATKFLEDEQCVIVCGIQSINVDIQGEEFMGHRFDIKVLEE